MLLATAAPEADARAAPVTVNGRQYRISPYVGNPPTRGMYVPGNETNDNGLPQGFLVEQPPGAVTLAHFHEVNQFQVFVGGGGQVGKHAADPVTVHYASAHSPYGPIVAGDDGIAYFTLRIGWDPGAKYMPGSRALRRRVPPRLRLVDRVVPAAPAAAATSIVLPEETDGLAAWLVEAPPGGAVEAPPPAGGGRYHVVLRGELRRPGALWPRLSVAFSDRSEPPLTGEAGPDGVALLVLQFPEA